MMDVAAVLRKCRALGAVFTPVGEKLRIQAPEPLPDEVMSALRESKSEILAELSWERRRDFECWVLEEWRRVSLPQWRRILHESVQHKNDDREEYARWMLREILKDVDYQEEQP